jgi:hypothetical protein
MNVLKEHIIQFWLQKTFHGVFQFLRDTIQMWLLLLAFKIIFAREDIFVLKDQVKEKHSFVHQVLTAVFQEQGNSLIVVYAQLVIIALTRPWSLLSVHSATIVQLD